MPRTLHAVRAPEVVVKLLAPGRRHLAQMATGAVDLLFPPICVGCDDRLPADLPAVALCPPCRRALPNAPRDALDDRLARFEDAAGLIDRRLALWTFDDGGVLQRLQHALKYRDRPTLGYHLGKEIGRFWRARGLPRPDAVVPVPLARARHLERGYNQAERLGAGIADALESSHSELLIRSRPTRSQTKLSREARRANVDGAFALTREAPDLAGKRVILVDDVLTTGATVLAAAKPLREAGAEVDLALLALTQE